MSWSQVFDYVRSAAGHHGVDGKEHREDIDLPMGARIGGLMQLQMSPLIRAQSNGSMIGMPSDSDTRIVAISQIKLNLDGALYRFYLATGDEDEKEKFLQVYSDAKGKPLEILFCTQLARVVPETAEEQEAYTGVAGAGLGDQSYTLWRDQLGDTFGEAELAQIFGEAQQIDFYRDVGDPSAAFVSPLQGKETRIDDTAGVRGLQQEMYYMPYVRELAGGGKEYLIITTEIIASVNGDTSKRGIHVDFVIGVPVEQERIVLQ